MSERSSASVADDAAPAVSAEVRRFRKKPVEIEAMYFSGRNGARIASWCGGRYRSEDKPSDPFDTAHFVDIPTLEGVMTASVGEWVIRGTRGEFYPCKPGPFADTFEEVSA